MQFCKYNRDYGKPGRGVLALVQDLFCTTRGLVIKDIHVEKFQKQTKNTFFQVTSYLRKKKMDGPDYIFWKELWWKLSQIKCQICAACLFLNSSNFVCQKTGLPQHQYAATPAAFLPAASSPTGHHQHGSALMSPAKAVQYKSPATDNECSAGCPCSFSLLLFPSQEY